MQYTGLDGSRDVFAPDASAHQDFQSRWLATFRGRFGWLANPNMYFYATGGLALANVNTDFQCQLQWNHQQRVRLNNTCGVDARCRFGMEVRPQWSAKVEYLYVDLGHATNPFPISNNDLSLTENIFRIGINYHFIVVISTGMSGFTE